MPALSSTGSLAPQLAGVGMVALMTSRISAEIPSIPGGGHALGGSKALTLLEWLR
ncbi:hypothetical protein ABFA25_08280 [Mycobacterium lepromatosis]|uniref:hypothetical protein n=1 Tax=Mycobacterium lepromatosis TaxID=480418 RepID=UPI00187315FA